MRKLLRKYTNLFVVFWKKLRHQEKKSATASRDGRDKFHVCRNSWYCIEVYKTGLQHENLFVWFSFIDKFIPRLDPRTSWPNRHGELSRYMYDNLIRLIDVWLDQFGTGHASGSSIPKISLRLIACSELGQVLIWIDTLLIMPRYAFWKIDPYAPAAQVDIRRKPQQCQRAHLLWISNKDKSKSVQKF